MVKKINLFYKRELFLLLLICCLAFSLRVFIFTISDNYYGSIPMGRVITAMRILKNPSIKENFNPAYAPFHLYLIAGVLSIWNDPLVAPRIIGLILGTLLIIPFYYYVKLGSNKEIAFFSSILVAVYPMEIIQSTLSGPEVPFHFFLFSSLCLFFFFKKNKKMFLLVLSAIFLNFACMIRFEGWLFIPLLALFLIKEKLSYKILFIVISMVSPIFWMYLNWQGYGDPLRFLHHSDLSSIVQINMHRKLGEGMAIYYTSLFNKIFSWPCVMAETIHPFIVILGFSGLIFCIFKRIYIYLIIPFLSLFLLFTYKIVNETWLIQLRYSLTLVLLLIPFSILGLNTLIDLLLGNLKSNKVNKISVVTFVLFISCVSVPEAIDKRPLVPPFVKKVSVWLKTNASTQDKIILDYDRWFLFHYNIIMASGLRPENCRMVSRKIVDGEWAVDKEAFLDYLKEEKPKFLLYCTKGYFPEFLQPHPEENKVEERYGFRFSPIYYEDDPDDRYGDYYIYKIEY